MLYQVQVVEKRQPGKRTNFAETMVIAADDPEAAEEVARQYTMIEEIALVRLQAQAPEMIRLTSTMVRI